MALVDSVPAGQYGRAASEWLGAWEAIEPLVAQSEAVRAALVRVPILCVSHAPAEVGRWATMFVPIEDGRVTGVAPKPSHGGPR